MERKIYNEEVYDIVMLALKDQTKRQHLFFALENYLTFEFDSYGREEVIEKMIEILKEKGEIE